MNFHRSRRRRPSSDRTPSHGTNANHRPAPQPAIPAPRAIIPLTPEVEAAVAASPFTKLGLVLPLVRAALEQGYVEPSPVQAEVVPHAITGRDILAGAQTGTGKTAAFVFPILQQLAREEHRGSGIRALILTPTRELAAQIGECITNYGTHLSIRHAVIYGGVNQRRNENDLRLDPALLVATPGRLLDLIQQGFVDLSRITHFVLDEADRMLDMGFVRDVQRVVAMLPKARQTLFFSATIAPAIETLARSMLTNPVRVSISPATTTATTVEHAVMFVAKADKRAALEKVLLDTNSERTLVFTRTKHGANRLSDQLDRAGIGSAAIHGNKSQGARERALDGFRRGTTRVLVATDVAARGIDIEGVSLVVNFDLPNVAESYVHRIGRTGRAGASGRAISFCDHDERAYLADIERLIKKRLPVMAADPRRAEPDGRSRPNEHVRAAPSASAFDGANLGSPRPVASPRSPREDAPLPGRSEPGQQPNARPLLPGDSRPRRRHRRF